MNHHNDVFTTFQKSQYHHTHSPATAKFHAESYTNSKSKSIQIQHHQIESLKNTLKSITPVPSIELNQSYRVHSESMNNLVPKNKMEQSSILNKKLDELTRNLLKIADKSHFCVNNNKNRTKSYVGNTEGNQPKDRIIEVGTRLSSKKYQAESNDDQYHLQNVKRSTELPISKSYSFTQKNNSKQQANHCLRDSKDSQRDSKSIANTKECMRDSKDMKNGWKGSKNSMKDQKDIAKIQDKNHPYH